MLWQQRQNLGQWRIRPLPPIPKSKERNRHIPPKDILSHRGLNHPPTNATVESPYFYGQTVTSTLMPDIPTSTIKVIHMFHLVPKNGICWNFRPASFHSPAIIGDGCSEITNFESLKLYGWEWWISFGSNC